MSEQSPHDILRTVNRRWDCLQAIVEQPQEKRQLVETLQTPRSTLDAIVRELEQADLVLYHEGVWQPTVIGQCVAEMYADCTESLSTIHAAGSVLSPLAESADLPRAVLDGAETFEASAAVPDAILVEFLDRIAAADRIRGVAPCALSGYTEQVFTRAVDNGTTLELVLAESVFDKLTSLTPKTIADGFDREGFSLYHGSVPVSFGFWIGDSPTHVGIIVYADCGIHGLLINESEPAVDWAIEQYESIIAEATCVTEAGIDQPTP